jgi:cytochrome c-type biogenesis protein CcmH/NrfG
MTSADLLLHPVRLRLLRAFLGDRALTTAELRQELSDVPVASLYRHVARLVDAGVLAVVSERQVRGAVERTYVLRNSAGAVNLRELAKMTPDQHRQAFLAFIAGLVGDFDRYLARGHIDLLRDGVSYSMAGLWLDEAERQELARELITVLQPRLANAPKTGRQRWVLGTIVLPGGDSTPPPLDDTKKAGRARKKPSRSRMQAAVASSAVFNLDLT